MALPLLLIFNAGRIVSIAVRAGTALARFVAKNPLITGGTISLQAISSAILSHEATEKEKIQIVDEIRKENPQLGYDLLKNMFFSDNNLLPKIVPYLVLLLIVYYILKK